MPLRLSTGLRNSLMGNAFLMGTSLSYSDNGASEDTILDTENRFITAGFRVGDNITSTGATTGGNDLSGIAITGVTASTLSMATGNLAASEAFLATTKLVSDNGGSLQTLLMDGIIRIYSGAQPTDPDAAETGTLLVEITVASGAFVAGSAANGLELDPIISGVLSKATDEVWSGVAVATGGAGWFRFYANDVDTSTEPGAVHIDGSVGTSGATLNLSSTSITLGATVTIDGFDLTEPAV